MLLVDDDRELCQMLTEYLDAEHFDVKSVHDGGDALEELKTNDFELLILDVMLPSVGGFDVLRKLGADYATPILMLTARGEPIDRILGLELGADDYLPKPFQPRELLARLRAILRRRSRALTPGEKPLTFGRLEIDTAAHAVRLDGVQCELTGYQFDLLVTLARNAGRVLSRDALLDAVKGEQLESFDRSIDVHVSRIRAAIEDNPKKPRRVITIRGSGYVFAKAQD